MSKGKKKQESVERKKLQEEKNKEKLAAENEEREKREQAAQEKRDEKEAENEAQMDKVKSYKYLIATLAALCFVFIAGIAYNYYCSNGHLFDGEVEYFYDNEDSWHAFNGRYVRIPVDAAMKWYDGVGTDEMTGELTMTKKKASCLIWLNSDTFMSLTVDNDEDFDKVNAIIDATTAYTDALNVTASDTDATADATLDSEKIYFEGQLKRPGDAEFKKFKQAYSDLMAEWGFAESDYYLYELTLDTSANKSVIMPTTIAYSVLAVIFLIATIIASVKYHQFKKINGIKIVRE